MGFLNSLWSLSQWDSLSPLVLLSIMEIFSRMIYKEIDGGLNVGFKVRVYSGRVIDIPHHLFTDSTVVF